MFYRVEEFALAVCYGWVIYVLLGEVFTVWLCTPSDEYVIGSLV